MKLRGVPDRLVSLINCSVFGAPRFRRQIVLLHLFRVLWVVRGNRVLSSLLEA